MSVLLFGTSGQSYFSYFVLNNKLVILSTTAKVHGQYKQSLMHLDRTYSTGTSITVQYGVCYVLLLTVELWCLTVLGYLNSIFDVLTTLIKPKFSGDVDARKPKRNSKIQYVKRI